MRANLPAVRNKMQVDEFRPGKGTPSLFSASDMNVHVAILRALVNPQIIWTDAHDKAELTDGNFTIQLSRSAIVASGAQMYRLKSVQDDYVTARTWDGTNEGATDAFIAKEYKARCSLTGETIFGIAHIYTYAAGPDSLNVQRTNDDGTHTETEIVVPPWVPDEIFYAVQVTTDVANPDGGTINLLMFARSAQWAKYP
jgi:hypothetical protein